MKRNRILSAAAALVFSAGMVSAFPQITQDTYAAEVVSDTFEVSYDGWHSNADNVVMTAVDGIGYGNSRGMSVTGRLSNSDGAASSKGFYLAGGIEYQYSVMVKTEEADNFHLTLLYIDDETEKESIVELASKKVKAGKWTELTASFKAPKNTYEYMLTLTTDTTADFVFDDVKVTTDKENTLTANAAVAGKGLKDEFANYFRVGNILNGGTVKNSTITAEYLKDFNAIECENETKPDATLVRGGNHTNTNIQVSLNSCAAIADFCSKNGLGFRGHTLVWHSQTPQWFFKDNFQDGGNWVSQSVMDQRLESYIKNLFNAFKTQYPNLNLYAYDVANECMNDSNGGPRQGGYGNGASPWTQIYGGNGFIEKAFKYARQYAPEGCELCYNDYNEYMANGKKQAIMALAKDLYGKGLLDAVGMQSHVPANATGFAGTVDYLQAMDDYLAIGCNVQVTELDISVENGKYSYQDQATKYKAIYQHAVDVNKNPKAGRGNVTLVQVWGPNDANSWLSSGSNALLFDGNHQPKLAYNTLINLLPDSEWGDGSNPAVGGGEVKDPEPNEYGWWYQCGFENGDDNWTNRGGNTVAVSDAEHYTEWGSHSLYVTDRTSAWMGASLALNSRIFKAGTSHSFSAHVKQKSGENVKFMMKIEYTDASGETAYDEVANVVAPSDTWAQLVNTSYTIPADASNIKIYVETEESLTNFYLDEAIGAKDGTGIAGEGAPVVKTFARGDINSDGVINAADVSLARIGLTGKFADSDASRAADVDQSGKFELNDMVLIQQFVLKRITEFPVAEKQIDLAAMEAAFKGVNIGESFKKATENNPLYTQRFGADPGWLVYNDRLYVYTTADAFEYKNGQLQENSYASGAINVLSTADLVNWTDHGQIPVARTNVQNPISKWANNAWAPDAAWKNINGKDQFFLYFANNGSGIGVITADDPTFKNAKDPLGKEMISRSTPNSNVTWLFDPGVYYDQKTNTGIIAYGGGVPSGQEALTKQGRIAKLGDDMISIVGTPVDPGTPYLFEDSSMIKIGDNWVYSFCHNWNVPGGANVNGNSFSSADIGYMTSTNPLSGYQYQGVVFKNTGSQRLDNGGNNHHSIIEFKGNYYVLYHSRQLEMRMGVNGGKGLNYRSPCIDKATVNGNKISCSGSQTGVSQIEKLNPFTTVQAETMANQSKNISVTGLSDTVVNGGKGEWICVKGVDFKNGADSLTVKASSKSGAVIKVCTGSANGTAITYAEIPAGSSMSEITVPVVNSVTGSNDVYFVFSGDLSFDSWSFK